MPALAKTLPANDLGFLRIVASLWGIELLHAEPGEAALELSESMLDAELMEEVITTLPDPARQALQTLFGAGGRLAWVQFARRFGEIREMGPAKRDREQPHSASSSAAETLYYRALIGRAFFDTPSGSQEFAYIPDDLLQALEFIGFEGLEPEAEPDARPEPESESEPDTGPEADPQPEAAPEPEYADLDESEYAEYADVDVAPSDGDEPDEAVIPSVSAGFRPARPERVQKPPVMMLTPSRAGEKALGRAATPTEKAHTWLAGDHILDDATTLLAALRLGSQPPTLEIPIPVLTGLLTASGFIGASSAGKGAAGGGLQPEAVRDFLEAPRAAALAALVAAWQASQTFNELRLLPGLACEGAWENQPLVTREFLLDLLQAVPDGIWWSIPSFIREIKQKYPDFQRPAGDYDTWFIKRLSDHQYLRGFEHWEDVDGALIRYFFQLQHWLGQVDLAAPDESAAPTAFRLVTPSAEGQAMQPAQPLALDERERMLVTSQGRITVPRLAPRASRYQVARFCDWEVSPAPDEYRYQVTPASLKRAAGQGLKVSHLLGLLAKQTGGQIPPVFAKALQRWEANGAEARLETVTVLKVSKPEVLAELRASRAGRFLGEILGPTTVTLQAGAKSKVRAALAELGLLAEVEAQDNSESG